jgi:hypothetical protein
MGGHIGTITVLAGLAIEMLRQGDDRRAATLLAESLALSRRLGISGQTANALEVLAGLAQRRGRTERAVRLYGAAEALREARAFPRPATHARLYEAAVAVARSALDEPAFSAAWAAGRTLGWDEVLAEASAEVDPPDEPPDAAPSPS